MFVKITNGAVDQYPYTVGQLRRDNPNVSFPKNLSEERMAEYGMYRVYFADSPDYDAATQRTEHSNLPSLIDDKWTITHSVVDLTEAEIQNRKQDLAIKVRKQRDKLLAESDWVTVKAVDQNAQDGLGIQVPQVWLDYRQALRDITAHANFPYLQDSDWPEAP